MRTYGWVIDLNERGRFRAHVESESGRCLFSADSDDPEDGEVGELWLTRDGFMRSIEDVHGLTQYLIDRKVLPPGAQLLNERAWRAHQARLPSARVKDAESVPVEVVLAYTGACPEPEAMPWEERLGMPGLDVNFESVQERLSLTRHRSGSVSWSARVIVRVTPTKDSDDEDWPALHAPDLLRRDLNSSVVFGRDVRCLAARPLVDVPAPSAAPRMRG